MQKREGRQRGGGAGGGGEGGGGEEEKEVVLRTKVVIYSVYSHQRGKAINNKKNKTKIQCNTRRRFKV